MFRTFFKSIFESSTLGFLIVLPFYKLFNFFKYDLINDKRHIEKKFKLNMGKNLSLEDPKTLNEKISWLKLNDRTSLHTLCSDKYAVRQYIIEKIGDDFVVPLFFMTLNYREIILENLPDEPSIIKTNHDSGGGIFVYNKNELDYNKVQIILRKRMAINYYQRSNEWQYKNIVPCIIVEKLLQTKEGEIPKDYKLHCFNGKVRMISVDIDRGSENHKRNWYNKEWVREPYKWSSPKGNGRYTDPSTNDTPKPRTLNQMIELSETLSEPFVYVRVDWYDVDGKLFFGEMTFYHDGGNRPILPEKWDLELGSELHLNI